MISNPIRSRENRYPADKRLTVLAKSELRRKGQELYSQLILEAAPSVKAAVESALLNWPDEGNFDLVRKVFENRGMDLK